MLEDDFDIDPRGSLPDHDTTNQETLMFMLPKCEMARVGHPSLIARWFFCAVAALLVGQPAWAQSYPDKPIRLIVPFPPGGGIDAVARLIGKKLSEALGQPILVDNRAGANGSIGALAVAKAAPDGYTLLLADRGVFGVNPSLYKKLPYNPLTDFSYVGVAVRAPYVLVAGSALPVKDLPQLVGHAKANACKLHYGSFGIGSMAQMGMESLNSHYGVCTTHVPYKGGGPAVMAAVSGEVQLTMSTLAAVLPHIKDGRLKALVVGSSNRSPLLPQTASITEVGGDLQTMPETYFGFALPAQTPAPVVARLSTEIRRIVGSAEMQEQLLKGGFEAGEVSPEKMAGGVREDIDRFARLAKSIGIQPE